MTTISSLSQFLNSQTSQSSLANSGSSTSSFVNSTKSSTTKTGTTTSATADGDSVTLSAAAQALLAKDKESSTKKDYGFTLTTKQQEQLKTVLNRYKDKPQTQANFDAIQKDLKKLRLDTVNMAAKDSAKSFNIKSIMLSILAGKDVSQGTAERAQALAIKKSAYAEQIVADWAAIRTAANPITTMETTT